jgi:ribosome-binding ATPase YchF (GTP1/OBG family)
MLIGIVGAPNQGKSTLFNALTLAGAEVAPHPFTTIKPNEGVGYVKVKCPRSDCKPSHGYCIDSWRFIPVKLLDVAGLVPGASEGRGLGNQFMNDLSTADAFIIVVDASGHTGCEGEQADNHNPVETVKFIIEEIDKWFSGIIKRQWEVVKKRTDVKPEKLLAEKLSGLGINEERIKEAMNEFKDIDSFASKLRELSKPYLIAANKIDCKNSKENYKKLKEAFKDIIVLQVSGLIELTLKEGVEKEFLKYIPGESSFKEVKDLSDQQRKGLHYVRDFLNEFKSTGVQELINSVVFNLLKLKVSYPVQDDNKWADSKGNVLPDAYLLEQDAAALDLAYKVHTSIGEGFIKAIDARTKKTLSKGYVIKDGDIIKITAKT